MTAAELCPRCQGRGSVWSCGEALRCAVCMGTGRARARGSAPGVAEAVELLVVELLDVARTTLELDDLRALGATTLRVLVVALDALGEAPPRKPAGLALPRLPAPLRAPGAREDLRRRLALALALAELDERRHRPAGER